MAQTKYADHGEAMFTHALKHHTGHSAEFDRGFQAGMLAAAENIEAAAGLSFTTVEEARQFGLDAAADMRAKASGTGVDLKK